MRRAAGVTEFRLFPGGPRHTKVTGSISGALRSAGVLMADDRQVPLKYNPPFLGRAVNGALTTRPKEPSSPPRCRLLAAN